MSEKILTVGFSNYDDFHGSYFTCQSLRLHHPEVMKRVELVVVENNPASKHAEMLRNLVLGKIPKESLAGVKHVTHAENQGTSQTRNAIFENASGEFVLVMDCHVMLPAGALAKLLDFYDANPDTKDIYSGPLIGDDLLALEGKGAAWTHFNDQWRGQMWGTWGSAWKHNSCGQLITCVDVNGQVEYRPLDPPGSAITKCPKCDIELPAQQWAGHEQQLMKLGFTPYGCGPDDEPFEIPGQGLGLFTCRKDAWPGFNPHARGFGGEELYIHEVFRRNGGKAICLPWLPWLHRFGRVGGAPYPASLWNKVRNYVLEFNELGLPLDPIKEEFVRDGVMSLSQWQYLTKDPIARENPPEQEKKPGCGTCGGGSKTIDFTTVEEAFDIVKAIPRDLNEHMDKLKELAAQVKHVTEFSERRESTLAFLAAKPKTVVSHNRDFDGVIKQSYEFIKDGTTLDRDSLTPDAVPEIEETDLLFLDYDHSAGGAYNQLVKFGKSTKRYIVFHDTDIYGMKCPKGGAGVLAGINKYVRENPQWSIILHTKQQYGLTVLSCLKKDKPKLPSKLKMAANLAKAVTKYVASGAENVTTEQLEARLDVCNMCEFRNDSQCSICGCFIEKKAAMKTEDCPMAFWPRLDAPDVKKKETST